MRVGVVGGGAVGLTAARDLAAGGADVSLFERGEVGSGSTGRAAGVLTAAYPGATDARLGRRAIERFRELSGEGDFRFREAPNYSFVTEPGRKADALREETERVRERGFDVEFVDPGRLAGEFPAVRADDLELVVRGGTGGYAEPGTYADLMARKARDAGAQIREGVEAAVRADPPRVIARDEEGAFDAVLVAAGAWAKRLLADAGIPIPLKPYRVQALTCAAPEVPILHDATEGYYLRPHPAGLLAGNGTEHREADLDGWERDGDDEFVATTRRRLSGRLDGFGGDVERAWAGLCTSTPDRDPLLGEVEDGLYLATGWQGHGFVRSPATGEAIAEEILSGGGVPEYDPARFDGDEEFEVVEGMSVE